MVPVFLAPAIVALQAPGVVEARDAMNACYKITAASYDDGKSEAASVGKLVASLCSRESEAYAHALAEAGEIDPRNAGGVASAFASDKTLYGFKYVLKHRGRHKNDR